MNKKNIYLEAVAKVKAGDILASPHYRCQLLFLVFYCQNIMNFSQLIYKIRQILAANLL